MRKRIASLALTLGIALSVSLPVSAAKPELRQVDSLSVSVSARAATTTWKNVSNVFVCFKQELNDSCGPACVRMLLRVLNGKDYGEAAIRTGCKYGGNKSGTNATDMRDYINRMCSTKYSVYTKGTFNYTTFKNHIYDSIVNKHAPVILLVNQTKGTWPSGVDKRWEHFVVVKGISSDKTKLKIADPYKYSSNYYEISTETAYIAMTSSNLWDKSKIVYLCYLAPTR